MTNNELYHHGILGQKWGVRRYQNPDGSLTNAGKRRYSTNWNIWDEKEKNAKESASEAREIGQYQSAKLRQKAATSGGRKADRYNRRADRAANKWENIAKSDEADALIYRNKAERSRKRIQAIKDVESATTLRDRVIYNNATRQKAAEYVAVHNVPVDVAIAKANTEARRNTAIYVAAMSAITVAEIIAIQKGLL